MLPSTREVKLASSPGGPSSRPGAWGVPVPWFDLWGGGRAGISSHWRGQSETAMEQDPLIPRNTLSEMSVGVYPLNSKAEMNSGTIRSGANRRFRVAVALPQRPRVEKERALRLVGEMICGACGPHFRGVWRGRFLQENHDSLQGWGEMVCGWRSGAVAGRRSFCDCAHPVGEDRSSVCFVLLSPDLLKRGSFPHDPRQLFPK